jgi:hypothetical protein
MADKVKIKKWAWFVGKTIAYAFLTLIAFAWYIGDADVKKENNQMALHLEAATFGLLTYKECMHWDRNGSPAQAQRCCDEVFDKAKEHGGVVGRYYGDRSGGESAKKLVEESRAEFAKKAGEAAVIYASRGN